MPIYEYECQDCGHRLEVLQRMGERSRRRCPECKGKLKRLMSAPAFQFKGSGWYVTDYAKKDASGGGAKADSDKKKVEKDGAAGEAGSGAKSSSKSSSKSDSKSGGGKKSAKKKAEAS